MGLVDWHFFIEGDGDITGPSPGILPIPSHTFQLLVYNSALIVVALWSGQGVLENMDCERVTAGRTPAMQLWELPFTLRSKFLMVWLF